MKYLDIAEVMIIHDRMLKIGGGRIGVADFRLIHSAIARPQSTFDGKSLYPSIWLKAASLIHSLIKNHPFNDGNKRTGFFTTMRFLKINNYYITASNKEIIAFSLEIDTKNLNLNQIAEWFKEHSHKLTK